MAVMTSHLPSPVDVYHPSQSDTISPSPQALHNSSSLKSLLANSSSRQSFTARSPPPLEIHRHATHSSAQPLPPLPLSQRDVSKSQPSPTTALGARTNSISASAATSPVRPNPRFHVTNPTEAPSSLPPNKAPALKALDLSRPLPAPASNTGSALEGNPGRKPPASPSPPRIEINTSGLLAPSPRSPLTTTQPSPSASVSTSSSTAPSSSSSSSLHSKHMPKVTLPIGPLPSHVPPPLPLSDTSYHSGRTTPVATLPSPSSGGSRVRPLPPPPLPRGSGAAVSGPRTRSSSRGPSARSRTNSAVGRGDAAARPQLTFDPTSSSYVIKTAGELNSSIPTPPATASTPAFSKSGSRGGSRRLGHDRSRSAQFKSFSPMVIPDDRGTTSSTPNSSASEKWKGKQAVRSAPCSDTEDVARLTPSISRKSRPKFVLHNPSDSFVPKTVRSAPSSDTEDSTPSSHSSAIPASWKATKSEGFGLVSPLLLPPTGSIKDMLHLTIRTEGLSQSQPTKPSLPSPKVVRVAPLARQTPPPGNAFVTPPPSSLDTDIGYADAGYVDDARVYVDDGYDGPGGLLGEFSTSVDPHVDLDIGDMTFNTRPPSGEYLAPSVMDLDMDARGRHVSRPRQPRWKSEDSRAALGSDTDLQRRGSGKGKTFSHPHRSSRSSSQTVMMSSLKAKMRPVPEIELGPTPINMDLEPEMVFSKNPSSPLTPVQAVPGVLDASDRVYVRGKWRSPSPMSPARVDDGLSGEILRRYQGVSGSDMQFAPVRPRGFYEDW